MTETYELRQDGSVASAEVEALRRAVGWSEQGDYDRILAGSRGHFTARTEGRLIGFVNMVGDGVQDALLVDLIVHPDFQRRGLGRTLVQAAINRARADGVRYTQLVFAPELQGLYRKCGFSDFRMAAVIDNRPHDA